jgi:hypothetical protein
MATPTRLSRLLTFLNRPAASSPIPTYMSTALKIKAVSLAGALIYTLARSRTGELRGKDGRPNMGVFVREAIEEGRDRLRGWSENCEFIIFFIPVPCFALPSPLICFFLVGYETD